MPMVPSAAFRAGFLSSWRAVGGMSFKSLNSAGRELTLLVRPGHLLGSLLHRVLDLVHSCDRVLYRDCVRTKKRWRRVGKMTAEWTLPELRLTRMVNGCGRRCDVITHGTPSFSAIQDPDRSTRCPGRPECTERVPGSFIKEGSLDRWICGKQCSSFATTFMNPIG